MAKRKQITPEAQKTVTITHRHAAGFRTVPSEGAVISAPVGQDLAVSLTFYVDVIDPSSERLTLDQQNQEFALYRPDPKGIQTVSYREDQVRVVMSVRALKQLKELVDSRLDVLDKLDLLQAKRADHE